MIKFLKKIIHVLLSFFNLKITRQSYEKFDFPIVEADEYEKKLLIQSGKYSMTSLLRRWSLINLIKNVKNLDLDGDFVECGVWRGGNIIIFNNLNDKFNLKKKIYAFDTYSGMSEPTIYDKNYRDVHASSEWKKNIIDVNTNASFNCYSSLEEVKKNIIENSHSKKINNIHFIEGKVENTLIIEKNLPDKISILRLDTDWYESTKKELEILYPRLVKGGALIIDDYGQWKGSRKAVDEYFANQKVIFHYVDFSCRLLIKN